MRFPAHFPALPQMPAAARIIAPPERLSYTHVGRRVVAGEWTALGAWNSAMARPLPLMGAAFWLRDAISARFGVHKIGGFSGRQVARAEAGERLDFFLIEEISDQRLLLTERAAHLDVMTCITATPCAGGTEIAITSSVAVHNAFGRAYMLPVGPAHRAIVWLVLRRIGG